ncbi:hypothetical protein H6F44_06475 [Pseudanabaena sp. FACHB-1277]|uniref:Uncharacterized protein n=1 Tax=Pseudanabaena cinerea FACHB-1277 TaxID=2949581 RepID=A0A926UR86_9CYAN|nr:hypothetical protein [Pseudanabaena cinerea]MBD2149771.1 hypothetical protein [Pseudanabaena cinerea FACHB-1277]
MIALALDNRRSLLLEDVDYDGRSLSMLHRSYRKLLALSIRRLRLSLARSLLESSLV